MCIRDSGDSEVLDGLALVAESDAHVLAGVLATHVVERRLVAVPVHVQLHVLALLQLLHLLLLAVPEHVCTGRQKTQVETEG